MPPADPAPFRDWLERVLTRGESVQHDPPELAAGERPAVTAVLRAAFDGHALDVAGPAVPFDPAAAEWAAVVLARACWRLASGDDADPLPPDPGGATPAAALSADVCLRL